MHRNTLKIQATVKSGRSLSPSDSFLFSQFLGMIYGEVSETSPGLHYRRKKMVPKRKPGSEFKYFDIMTKEVINIFKWFQIGQAKYI